jgi:hypothetical protein
VNAIVRVTLFGMLVSGMAILSATPAESEPGPKTHKKDRHAHALAAGPVAAVHAWFSPREVQLIREYYGPRYRSLPPGLQKKLRRTGRLPPGWQKKLAPLPVVLEREFVVLPRGYRRGVIDGQAVVVDPRTHVIVDIAVLF